MFKKLIKASTAAGILGGGIFAADQLMAKVVTPNLPANFTNWLASNAWRLRAYQYGVGAFGALAVISVASKVLGLGEKSPIKPGASPV